MRYAQETPPAELPDDGEPHGVESWIVVVAFVLVAVPVLWLLEAPQAVAHWWERRR